MPGARPLTASASAVVRFRLVDGGVGRRVDDQARLQSPAGGHERIRVGEVQRGTVEGADIPQRRERARELEAHLPAGAGQQDAHQGKVSADASGGAVASRGLSSGVPSTGHAIPSAGSFHRRERSCSGA